MGCWGARQEPGRGQGDSRAEQGSVPLEVGCIGSFCCTNPPVPGLS